MENNFIYALYPPLFASEKCRPYFQEKIQISRKATPIMFSIQCHLNFVALLKDSIQEFNFCYTEPTSLAHGRRLFIIHDGKEMGEVFLNTIKPTRNYL